jgi:hypothetical protein
MIISRTTVVVLSYCIGMGCNGQSDLKQETSEPILSVQDDTAAGSESARTVITIDGEESIQSVAPILMFIFEEPDGTERRNIWYSTSVVNPNMSLNLVIQRFAEPSDQASLNDRASAKLTLNNVERTVSEGTVSATIDADQQVILKFGGRATTDGGDEQPLNISVEGKLKSLCYFLSLAPQPGAPPRAVSPDGEVTPQSMDDPNWESEFCKARRK